MKQETKSSKRMIVGNKILEGNVFLKCIIVCTWGKVNLCNILLGNVEFGKDFGRRVK